MRCSPKIVRVRFPNCLSPYFERRWRSLYEAFEDGRIDEARLKQVLATYLPRPVPGQPLWTGVDTTGIARPKSGHFGRPHGPARAQFAQV